MSGTFHQRSVSLVPSVDYVPVTSAASDAACRNEGKSCSDLASSLTCET